MEREKLEQLWSDTLRMPDADEEAFERIARGVQELYAADPEFKQHIVNRSGRVTEQTGKVIDAENFDLDSARAYVADELGFKGWTELTDRLRHGSEADRPVLFEYTVAAMERGDFSSFERMVGGGDRFHYQITDWHEQGLFKDEPETLAEVLSAACMLGQAATAEFLIDKGVDPYAGMKSWLAGPHYAVSGGRLDVVKMLLEKKIPMEVENRYGGTLLGQALWSAVNEHADTHAEIIEMLIAAGAHVWPETLEWWVQQPVPSTETKTRVAEALRGAAL